MRRTMSSASRSSWAKWSVTPENSGVQVSAAEVLCGHHFAGRGLHQRRAAEKYRALVAHDHGLVAHPPHVRPRPRCTSRAQGRDLRYAVGAEIGLVVEDATEVLTIREHLVLPRQKRTAGVHQVNARQLVLAGDLLGTQVFLDRDRVVGTAFDGGVVDHDHAFAPRDAADAGDQTRAWALVVIHPVGGERRQLQKRAARVEQPVHAVAWRRLSPADVAFAGPLRTAPSGRGQLPAQLLHQREVFVAVGCRRCHL